MGKLKVRNVKTRRSIAGFGILISLAFPASIYLLSGASFIGALAQISIILLVVGLPLSTLLFFRFNGTVRRYYRAKAKHSK